MSSKKTYKYFIIIITVIILVCAALVLIGSRDILQVSGPLSQNTSVPRNAFYKKDGQLIVTSLDKIAPKKIGPYDPAYSFRDIYGMQVSEDGRRLFYPSSFDNIKAEITCLDLTKVNRKIKVDSGINNFTINQDGTRIFYLKNYALYVSDLRNSEKIAAGVSKFFINKEGSRLVYITPEGRLFRYTEEKETVEIDSNVILKYVSLDLKTIYYLKDNALYWLRDGKAPQMIDSDVISVLHIYEDGSLYYQKHNPVRVSHYVNDDLAASDAAMKEPDKADFPDEKGYLEAYAKFSEKRARDNLRQAIKQNIVEGMESLYYYSNGQSTMVSEYCYNVWPHKDQRMTKALNSDASYFENSRPVMVYSQPKVFKINMSDTAGYNDIYDRIQQSLYNDVEIYICSGPDVLQKVADNNIASLQYDTGNDKIYYSVYRGRDTSCDMYCLTTDGSSVTKVKMAEEVYVYDCLFGKNLIYFKGGPDDILYINNNKIGGPAFINCWWRPDIHADPLIFTRRTDLELYKDGKVIKLANSGTFCSYYTTGDKTAYFISSGPDNNIEIGKLYLYDGSEESKLIDTDVSALIEPLENLYYSCWDSTPAYEIE